MWFLIKDDKLVEKYDDIWDKITKVIKNGFDNEPAYNGKGSKTKTKVYEGKTNTNFCKW